MKDARETRVGAPKRWPVSPAALSAWLFALLCAANQVIAQSVNDAQFLTPREYQRLNQQAREAYDKGVKAIDHVDPVTAIQMFDQASQADPNAVEMAFMTARLAYTRGRMVYHQEAAKYYELAEKTLQRIGQQKDLSPLVKHRYEVELKIIQDEKKKLGVRDARRKAIGDAFCKIYAKETYKGIEEGEGKEGKGEGKKPAGKKSSKSATPTFGIPPVMPPMGVAPGRGVIPPPPARPSADTQS